MPKQYVQTGGGKRLVRHDFDGDYVLLGGGKVYLGGASDNIDIPQNSTVEIDNGDGVLYIKDGQDLIVGIQLDILESVPESITDAPNGTEYGRSGEVTLYNNRFTINDDGKVTTYNLPRNYKQKIIDACDF